MATANNQQILQNDKYQNCIDACFNCAESCEYCTTCCLREQNVKMLTRCIQLNRDCATICLAAAAFMSRDSDYAKQVCNICADICEACVQECEKHTDMDHCQKCAQACRKCADECRKMSG